MTASASACRRSWCRSAVQRAAVGVGALYEGGVQGAAIATTVRRSHFERSVGLVGHLRVE